MEPTTVTTEVATVADPVGAAGAWAVEKGGRDQEIGFA
jgi:hypothetical protein